MESRPDLVTGTVFKTVVGAPHAPGRVRFPCGSAILLLLLLSSAAHAQPLTEVLHDAAHALATHACASGPAAVPTARFLLQQRGLMDTQVAGCVGVGATAAEADQAVETCVTARRAALTHASVERARVKLGRTHCAAAVLLRRLARVSGVPTRASPFAQLDLTAHEVAPGSHVEWLLMDPRGRVESLANVDNADGTHQAVAHLHGGEGRYTVQLMVDGPRGPEVAAQGVIPAGAADASPLPTRRGAALADETAVHDAVRLLRSQWGLETLGRSPALDGAAALRARAVAQAGVLQHLDVQQHGVVDAYAAQEDAPPVARLAEVLAAGPTAADALAALLESPAHRRHMMDPAFTQVGVALRAQPALGEMVLVMELSRPVDGAEEADTRARVLARLNEERQRHALPAFTLEPRLQDLATQHARRLAGARQLLDTLPDGRPLSDVAVAQCQAQRAGVQLYRVSRTDEVTPSPAILNARYQRVAVGAAQGRGVDGLYVVVLLTQP